MSIFEDGHWWEAGYLVTRGCEEYPEGVFMSRAEAERFSEQLNEGMAPHLPQRAYVDPVGVCLDGWEKPEHTCLNLAGTNYENYKHADFGCSECGYRLGWTDGEWSYCPVCGAKVIEEDGDESLGGL